MSVKLRSRASVSDHGKVVILRVLAGRREIRRASAQELAVDAVRLQMHERAAALDEVVALARIENDPDCDAAALSRALVCFVAQIVRLERPETCALRGCAFRSRYHHSEDEIPLPPERINKINASPNENSFRPLPNLIELVLDQADWCG